MIQGFKAVEFNGISKEVKTYLIKTERQRRLSMQKSLKKLVLVIIIKQTPRLLKMAVLNKIRCKETMEGEFRILDDFSSAFDR